MSEIPWAGTSFSGLVLGPSVALGKGEVTEALGKPAVTPPTRILVKISTLIYVSLCILKGITGEEENGEGPLTRISSEIPFNLMHNVKKAD